MTKHIKITFLAVALLTCCATTFGQKYKMRGLEHQRLTVDARYDAPNKEAEDFLRAYKEKVDSAMSPVVGHCASHLRVDKPESEMSNLLSDILMWIGEEQYGEKSDFSVYNIGGIRAEFPKGTITRGNVVDVAPFENKICFLTLKGSEVTELFKQIAARLGEGVSHGVELVITKDGKLKSAKLHGKAINSDADYRIATIDYLLEGSDGMTELRKGRNIIAPKDAKNDTRFLIMDYFRAMEAEGKIVDAKVEGRIVIE